MDHLMADLETKIAITFMTYIVDLDANELHPGDKKVSTTLSMNAKGLHYTYDWGSLLFWSIVVYLC